MKSELRTVYMYSLASKLLLRVLVVGNRENGDNNQEIDQTSEFTIQNEGFDELVIHQAEELRDTFLMMKFPQLS